MTPGEMQLLTELSNSISALARQVGVSLDEQLAMKRCVSNLKRVTDELASLVAEPERPSRPTRPEPEEPPRRNYRQSELGGIDMNDLLRQADRERKSRRLPSPLKRLARRAGFERSRSVQTFHILYYYVE